ncbi:MAG: proline--tRNA ligase, partial [bacterium]
FGVMRAREFIMKDGYSFDWDDDSAKSTYKKMQEAYTNIFRQCGLSFRMVEADSGNIGGNFSHEFMVLADSGEDEVAFCDTCFYAANRERAECLFWPGEDEEPEELTLVDTPGRGAVKDVADFLSLPASKFAKTLIFEADGQPVAVIIRGDRELNEFKLKAQLGCDSLAMAGEELVEEITGAEIGFAGPVGLEGIRILADLEIKGAANLVTGANQTDVHYKNVNPDRDFQVEAYRDLRSVVEGDACPRCSTGRISLRRGIEVGHTFKLGTRYTEKMNCHFKNKAGENRPMIMGCYGIGVGRTMAAAIEQNHDKSGIIWPRQIAPFQVILIPLDPDAAKVWQVTEILERKLTERGIEVLVDDRHERPGVKFKDADLIGIPCQVIIGPRDLKEGLLEIKSRSGEKAKVAKENFFIKLKEFIS